MVVALLTVMRGGMTVVWSSWSWSSPLLPSDDAGGGAVVALLTVKGWGVIIVHQRWWWVKDGQRARDLEKFLDMCMCMCL